jgi:hypothetical protein
MMNSFCGANPTIPATALPPGEGASLGFVRRIKPGSVLVRGTPSASRYGDRRGSVWDGETYRSLSHVARAIPGVRWNGPRFFGLPGSPGIGRRDCMRGPAYTR